jgi:hypothetical protein
LTGGAVGGFVVYKVLDKIFRIVTNKDDNHNYDGEYDHDFRDASPEEIKKLLVVYKDAAKMV